MIIVRLLSAGPVGWHQLYSGVGADIVMESITLVDVRDLVKVARENTDESCKM